MYGKKRQLPIWVLKRKDYTNKPKLSKKKIIISKNTSSWPMKN